MLAAVGVGVVTVPEVSGGLQINQTKHLCFTWLV